MDIEKITSPEQLSGEQRELAEIIGLNAYKKWSANTTEAVSILTRLI